MSLLLYRGVVVNCDSYDIELNFCGAASRLGVTTQEYGRVYRIPVALDCKTDNPGDSEEDTET